MIKKIYIGKRVISDSNTPLVVAEISANHQNSLKKLCTAEPTYPRPIIPIL